jgi:ABC-type polysaccharide/polyol phosphate export permease
MAPSFPMPGLSATLETASRLIPTYYFVEALKLSLAGTVSAQLGKHLVVVFGCTLLALLAAIWGLRRQQN